MTGEARSAENAETRKSTDGLSLLADPRFEEEPCWGCGGQGCGTCANTGLLYTEAAIRLQLEDRDRDN